MNLTRLWVGQPYTTDRGWYVKTNELQHLLDSVRGFSVNGEYGEGWRDAVDRIKKSLEGS